jgi:hypothetical protein
MVDDADCEILLESDKAIARQSEFEELLKLARYSGETFCLLYDHSELKDWVDETRIRETFYGQNKKTIREIFDHVNSTQYYYLSRTGVSFAKDGNDDFMRRREFCLGDIEKLYSKILAPSNGMSIMRSGRSRKS